MKIKITEDQFRGIVRDAVRKEQLSLSSVQRERLILAIWERLKPTESGFKLGDKVIWMCSYWDGIEIPAVVVALTPKKIRIEFDTNKLDSSIRRLFWTEGKTTTTIFAENLKHDHDPDES